MEASAGTAPAATIGAHASPPLPSLSVSSSPPRRLGLLRCPNAETLGWGRAGAGGGGGDDGEAAGDRAVTWIDVSQAVDGASSEPVDVDVDGSSTPPPGVGDGIESAPAADGAPLTAASSRTDDRCEREEMEAPKAGHEGALSVGKRRRLMKIHTSSADEDGEPSETEEPMKGGDEGFERGGYGAGSSNLAMRAKGTTGGSEPLPMWLETSLEYEPATKDVGDSPDGRGRGQILTVTYLRGDDGPSAMMTPGGSSIILGAISGRAIIEVLDSPPPTPHGDDGLDWITESGGQSEEGKSEGSSLVPKMYLDVFGYRIRSSDDGNTRHSKNRSFIEINRPSWMKSLPIAVVCRWVESAGGTSPAVLHVRVCSLPTEEDGHVGSSEKEGGVGGDGCYYGAHRAESYRLDMLPPNLLYPGNCAPPGSRACVVLKPWKEALDEISGGTTDCVIHHPPNSQNCVSDARDARGGNRDRILLCGAKGVGKSTLLRYVTNRMLSVPAPCDAVRKVAILDLDCGQPELSPPGMLTLTVLSRPLLSDPPVHMVCGGSCDHYGRKAGRGGHHHWNRGDSVEYEESPAVHEAAYFFGDVTSKSDPDAFVHMASQLMQRYGMLRDRICRELPLIVNTDGWVKGLGFELLSAIVRVINPGHIIQITGGSRAKSFDMSSHVAPGRSIHVVPTFNAEGPLPCQDDDCGSRRSKDSGASTATPGVSSSDHRTHRLCAYFLGGHDTMTTLRSEISGEDEPIVFHREKGLCDPNAIVGSALASMLPYAVPYHSVRLYPAAGLVDSSSNPARMWGIPGNLACDVVLESLNGSIVGLCRNPDAADAQNFDRGFGAGVPGLDCVGLGIVRSVDHVRKILFVLTPVHLRLLEGVTSLVGASFGLPVDCVYRGARSDSFPYLSCGHVSADTLLGAGAMRNKKLHSREKN